LPLLKFQPSYVRKLHNFAGPQAACGLPLTYHSSSRCIDQVAGRTIEDFDP